MSRNYCFTDFNMTQWDDVYKDDDSMVYIAYGKETCPDTGRMHYQGWVQFDKRQRFKRALAALGGHVALFRCKGTEEQNNKYCRKDNDFKSLGSFTTQGERVDLVEMCRAAKDVHIPLEECAELNPGSWVRYYRGFMNVRMMAVKSATTEWRDIHVSVYSGTTGTGKTRKAVEAGGYMIHGDNLQWWDGYEGERRIIIDEYSNQIPITKLLGILDGYQLRLPIKGGFTYANWTRVIITTNLAVLHVQAKEEHQLALERRIHTWENFDFCTEVTGNITVTSTQNELQGE